MEKETSKKVGLKIIAGKTSSGSLNLSLYLEQRLKKQLEKNLKKSL